jgi:aspartate aminotransferase-like enzyme
MGTSNPILLSTSSGSGLMEGSVRSLCNKKTLVFSVGAFGNRWHRMIEANGISTDLVEIEWGKAVRPELVEQYLSTGAYDVATITHNETSTGIMNNLAELSPVFKKYPDVQWVVDTVSALGGTPIAVDEWGIDVCLTSSQKALGLPPGLALCSVSQKALDKMPQVKYRGWYFDLLTLHKSYVEKNFQTPATPAISLVFALDVQLQRIFTEGLENRYQRHRDLSALVKEWAKEHFSLFPEEAYASVTLTTIANTLGFSITAMNAYLGEHGFQISNGYGDLKEKTFRIAHMADRTMEDTQALLDCIDGYLVKQRMC